MKSKRKKIKQYKKDFGQNVYLNKTTMDLIFPKLISINNCYFFNILYKIKYKNISFPGLASL